MTKPTKSPKPATRLMKTVAELVPDEKGLKKAFSSDEIAEIRAIISKRKEENSKEKRARDDLYRKIKRQVKTMENGNKSRVIVFPSLKGEGEWYKMINFSALYYAYELAERMGRSVILRNDNDRHSRGFYVASINGIEKFKQQFEEMEHPKVDVTEDGIYIFTLKKPLTDDDVGRLRNIEETRRERTHNVFKPKAMAPATYQAILTLVRQLLPRIRKLEKQYYLVVGEKMAADIMSLTAIYFCFSDGAIDKKVAGIRLIAAVDSILAGVAIMAEIQIWQYDVATSIGENANTLKQIIIKDFKIGEKTGG